ncbi:adenylate cyclase [Methylomarinovum caldicuralii]|uniref:Adenylate cyclase n=1 Tax=Methylomarinovum caldicuralii TaxID=438856 RepID=A0AAU9C942_9GAMM|nr:CYTH domain-containing protein [Methylomarinovum caldicuralii]BCX82041.1 adenylate cyclase [Methylomarinovum caldicuralii]
MALEIERKFLVRDDRWRALVSRQSRIRQGYLNQAKNCSVRVRSADGHGWLNIKSVTIGARRHEYEYEIPWQDAEEMLDTLCRPPLIEKTRYFVEHQGHLWEIDVFEGDNAGLVVAEIELNHPHEPFVKPPWIGREVTEDPRYYNTCLAQNPYRNWRDQAPAP